MRRYIYRSPSRREIMLSRAISSLIERVSPFTSKRTSRILGKHILNLLRRRFRRVTRTLGGRSVLQVCTPCRSAPLSLSTRLPIELVFSVVDQLGKDQSIRQLYVTSDERLRSAVRGEVYEPFANLRHAKSSSYEITVKSRSVDLVELGQWKSSYDRRHAPRQKDVMHESAHTWIERTAKEFKMPFLVLRESANPHECSDWMHLIAYSHSAEDPQTADNLVAGSAGANYDHIIFENAVIACWNKYSAQIHTGRYTVTAECINTHVALRMTCELRITFNTGESKSVKFIFDPTKPKLTDKATAGADEDSIISAITSFFENSSPVITAVKQTGPHSPVLFSQVPVTPPQASVRSRLDRNTGTPPRLSFSP